VGNTLLVGRELLLLDAKFTTVVGTEFQDSFYELSIDPCVLLAGLLEAIDEESVARGEAGESPEQHFRGKGVGRLTERFVRFLHGANGRE